MCVGVLTGGTFALFSLLKRQAGLGVGSQLASDRHLTNYSSGPRRKASWKETIWGHALTVVAGSRDDAGDWRQRFIQVLQSCMSGCVYLWKWLSSCWQACLQFNVSWQ